MAQTLLLADDNLTIHRVVALTFADQGIAVVAVNNGDQAIARIESDPPDIVLADIGLSGRTGYDVAQHIKQSPRLAHIPVLLLTGAFEPVDEQRLAAAGCDGVIAKPLEPQVVIGRVKALLAQAATFERPPVEPSEPYDDQPRPPDVLRLDDYFDELDAAFASRPESALPPVPVDTPAPDVAREERPTPVTVLPPPSLAEAFAALLAAEERGTAGGPLPLPPTDALPHEELVEEVTRRVLDRLFETVARDRAADLVSAVAERLVRDEIERLKSSIT